MSLELEINVDAANAALEKASSGADKLQKALEGVGQTSGLDKVLNTLEGMKGVPASVVQSLKDVGAAIENISKANALTTLSTALGKLAQTDMTKVAANVAELAKSLAGITVPASLGQISKQLGDIGAAATSANTHIRSLSSSLGAIQAPAGISTMGNHLNSATTAANSATTATQGFGASISQLNGLLATLGIAASAAAMSNFVSEAFKGVQAIQLFNNQMSLLGGGKDKGGLEFAANQMAILRKVSTETGQNWADLAPQFGKFTNAVVQGGVSIQTSNTVFRQLSTSFRVLGLDAEQTKRAFNAFEQMFSKGAVSMQELRQQLGNAGVQGMALFAQATGKSTAEFEKLVSTGQVSSREVVKLADFMYNKFKSGLPDALQTLTAMMSLFGGVVADVQQAFGKEAFGTGFISGMSAVSAALSNVNTLLAATNLGVFFSELTQGFATVIAGAISFGTEVVNAIANAADVLGGMATWIATNVLGITSLSTGMVNLANVIGAVVAAVALFAAGAAIFWTVGVAVTALSGVFTALAAVATLTFSPMLIYIAAAAAALYGLAQIAASVMSSFGNDTLTKAMEGLKAVIPGVVEDFDALNGRAKTTNEELNGVASSVSKLSKATDGASYEVDEFSYKVFDGTNAISLMNKQGEVYGATYDKVGRHSKTAGTAIGDVAEKAATSAKAMDSAAGAGGKMGGGIDTAKDAAVKAIVEFDNLTAAANRAVAAMGKVSSAGGGGGKPAEVVGGAYDKNSNPTGSGSANGTGANQLGGSSGATNLGGNSGGDTVSADSGGGGWKDITAQVEADSFSGGGLTSQGSRNKVTVNAGVFGGAPHFAEGGLSGGGIPAILHPNEAVVPLTGGGAIPIAGGGGGGGFPVALAAHMLEQLTISVFKQDETIDAIRVFNAIFIDKMEILTQAEIDVSNQIVAQTKALDASLKDAAKIISDSNAAASARSSGSSRGGSSASADTGGNGITLGSGAMGGRGGPGAGHSSGGWTLTGDSGARGSFAMGSPNASRDMGGGFTATLHPDEAVIPLPDGRAVPVDISGLDALRPRFDPDIERKDTSTSRAESTSGSNGAGGRGNVTVHMTVNAKDANSFRQSQDQIVQELQTKLTNATRTLGNNSIVDDPTTRASDTR